LAVVASAGDAAAASDPRAGHYDPWARNYAYYAYLYAYNAAVYENSSSSAQSAYANAYYAYYYLNLAWNSQFDGVLDGSVSRSQYAYTLNLAHYYANQAYYHSYVSLLQHSGANASATYAYSYYMQYYANFANYQGAPNDGLTAELRTLRDRHNAERLARGLNRLKVDWRLVNAAQGHANWMAANNTMSHTGAGGSSSFDRAVAQGYQGNSTLIAENIGYGYPTELEVYNAWVASPGHYSNIVYPGLRDVGVAVTTSPSTGQRYWSITFGTITN
jgi:uncharacterized protein YkwD